MKRITSLFKFIIIAFISSCIGNETGNTGAIELSILWNIETNLIDVPDAQPLIIEDSKIIYTGESELVAVDINNGDELWTAYIDGEQNLESVSLLYDKSSGIVASNHFEVFKTWNAETGAEVFTLTAEDGILAFKRGRNTLVNNGYGLVGDTLDAYVINTDGSIRFKVEVDFGTLGVAYGGLKFVLAQGKTITGALSLGKIRAFDSQTGDSLWIFETDKGGFGVSSPIIQNSILYAGTRGNSPNSLVVALNADSGELIWEYISNEPKEFTNSLLVPPSLVLFGASGRLVALNKTTGAKEWQFDWSSSTIIKPVYLEGYVYHSDHNRIFVLDAETGKVVHREPVPDGTYFWHLAVSKDKLFAQTSNQLIAYQPWHLRED